MQFFFFNTDYSFVGKQNVVLDQAVGDVTGR